MKENNIISMNTIKIPKEFYNSESKSLFTHCKCCNIKLDTGVPYMVEKAFKGNETVFEFAICHPCIENLHAELSEKSLQTIEE